MFTVEQAITLVTQAEPNWPAVVRGMDSLIQHIPLGWGTHDELTSFWIEGEFHMFGSDAAVESIAMRYQIPQAKARDIATILEPFSVLAQYE